MAPIGGLIIGMFLAFVAAEAITKLASTHWRYSIRTLFYAVALISIAMFMLVARLTPGSYQTPPHINSATLKPLPPPIGR
jgi:hypothetical protein